MTSPYVNAAMGYFDLGYSPIPLPVNRKTWPPSGFTGWEGQVPTRADIGGWIAEGSFQTTKNVVDKDTGEVTTKRTAHKVGNIGLRLPEGVLGIDVDQYSKNGVQKAGADTIEAAERKLGVPLPPTWVSTSRPGTPSGVKFYRVPVGLSWRDLPDVEMRHFGCAYIVVSPSRHPEGMTYCWLAPDGTEAQAPPPPEELPELPPEWVDYLSTGKGGGTKRADVNSSQVEAILAEMPTGEPCDGITTAAGKAMTGKGRHPGYLSAVAAIVALGRLGCPGAVVTLNRLRDAFLAEVVGTGPGQRTKAKAEAEWSDSLTGAVAKYAKDPQRSGCTHLAPWPEPDQTSPRVSHVPETDNTDKSAKSGPRLIRGTDLAESEPTRWLVRGQLPLAQVAVLIGDEGIGKSLWWVLVVSHLTTGLPNRLLGIPEAPPRDVILVLTEDSWTTDVRPRLEVAGADLDRVHVIAEEDDGSGTPMFPRDFQVILNSDIDAALIVVDAWLDTVQSGLSVKDPQQARQALGPWRAIAQSTGASVLLLAHSNRADEGSLRNRVGATAALRQKARMLLYAARPPEAEGVMYLGPDKANGTARGNAIAYRLDIRQVRPATADDPGTVARLLPESQTTATMEAHYANWRIEARRSENPSADDRAWDWLAAYIAQHGIDSDLGRYVPAVAAQEAAHRSGHNPQRLARLVKMHGGWTGPNGAGAPHVYRLPPSDGRQTSQTSQSRQSQGHGEVSTKSPGEATVTVLRPKGDPA